MVVYYLVFGVLLGRGGDGFTTFLLTGLIPWMWFNKAVSSSGNSIVAGQGLLLQVSVSPAIFPLISILQASLKQIPVFFLLLVFIWFQGVSPSLIWLNLLPLVLLQLLMTIAVGGLLAALMPFARDIGNLVPTGLTFVMFMSGIFYSYKDVPSEWQSLFLLNPIAFLLKSYREILIEGVYPSVTGLVSFAFIAIIGCAAVALLISRLRYTYPKIVLS